MLGLILLIVPGIIFAVVFGFYGFVIAERGDGVGITESLQRSADLTRGHRWQLFGLSLLILLINIGGFAPVLRRSAVHVGDLDPRVGVRLPDAQRGDRRARRLELIGAPHRVRRRTRRIGAF